MDQDQDLDATIIQAHPPHTRETPVSCIQQEALPAPPMPILHKRLSTSHPVDLDASPPASPQAPPPTPLISAAVFGKTEIARVLIEAGAEVNLKNNEGSTPLHSAAFLCRLEIVEMLLENGADKDLLNNYGSTAQQSVMAPFSDVKFIYDQFSKDLGPLGFKLDYEYVEATRPKIAELLK